jgi:hypothetical protein
MQSTGAGAEGGKMQKTFNAKERRRKGFKCLCWQFLASAFGAV